MEFAPEVDVYIRPKERLSLRPGEHLTVGQAAEVVAVDSGGGDLRRVVVGIPVSDWSPRQGGVRVVQAIDLVAAIKRRLPHVNVHLIGPTETIVDLEEPGGSKPSWLKVAAVWLLLFVGSGLTIMNFHADVSMVRVHQRVYHLITGEYKAHPYILQIPYAFGVGLGMALFFNHLLRRKINENEPSPLEVEVFQYEQMINQYVITREGSRQERVPDPREAHGS
ncbi:stage V sporulation protein AA [Kyrpidia spormannii]|uniref:Stage V sporulation protein AA n=2 Tax=Kyrpidia spormannii TaxID=2055160 RepID=A0A2K8N5Y6_9BACL|nr:MULTISPECIES: stage V sporulation protein AA [Kyrpidia]HHY68185.1 stage V sporulation protein AA [Alicyclobacillus sp.]ATY84748.1 stage V sporulation protein AA [Kyrpidia spormannii]MCL6575503.1 stage V sporulation protein AA [Kyrpidia sp.]CAB3391844.1 stage V sporulation protein AA [Kyrpidia spormannii]CAB3392761.1 stage V sporulation protein AA [Kyrpidia spormannii]